FLYFFAYRRIKIDKIDFKTINGHLPGPFFFVPLALIRQGITIKQFVMTILSHSTKSTIPACPRPMKSSNDDLSIFNFEFYFIKKAALLK
ncbi:MAG: hypothetical protein MN733_41585, partial [Nitrososphaera sp.]|nr:hypothetical protein [Nitrososphaera sp.]